MVYKIKLAAEDKMKWNLTGVVEALRGDGVYRVKPEHLVDGFIPLIDERMIHEYLPVNYDDTYIPTWTYDDEPKLPVIGMGWGKEQERKERFLQEVRAAKEYENKMEILFDDIARYLGTRFVNLEKIPRMFKRDPFDSPMFRFVKGNDVQGYSALEGEIKKIPILNLKHFVYAVMADQMSFDLGVRNEGNEEREKARKDLEQLMEANNGLIKTLQDLEPTEHKLRPFSVCMHDYLQYFLGRFIGLNEYGELTNRSRYNPSGISEEYFDENKNYYLKEYNMRVVPHRKLELRGVATDEENRAYLLETVVQVGNLLEKCGFKVGVE